MKTMQKRIIMVYGKQSLYRLGCGENKIEETNMQTKHRVSGTKSDMTIEELEYMKTTRKNNMRKSIAKRKVKVTLPHYSFMDK